MSDLAAIFTGCSGGGLEAVRGRYGGGMGAVRGSGLKSLRQRHLWCSFCLLPLIGLPSARSFACNPKSLASRGAAR